ncbi:MAG: ATP-binding protein [Bacteroides sp.]|nr:ATP-binding protein [Bacteroides sp.]
MKETFLYPTKIQSIASIRSDLKAFAENQKVPAPELRQITIIIEELFSKIVKTAFDGKGDHVLEISISKTNTEILIEIIDDGYPFNPTDHSPFQASNPTSTDEEDMGLSLIKAFSDSIQYTREEQKNILLIQKIIRSQANIERS